MGIADFLRKLRGQVTGFNAISARFDILQMQNDRVLQLVDQLTGVDVSSRPATRDSSGAKPLLAEMSGVVASSSPALESDRESHSSAVEHTANERSFDPTPAKGGQRLRIVFFVITPELWPSFEPIWERAQKDERYLTAVVALNTTDPDMALTSQFKARALLESRGIPYFTEQTFSLVSYRPHVLFYPLPYSSLYPAEYKPEAVAAMGYRIAYVPYGLEVGGGLFNARYQYDSEVPRVAWRIFARSRSQLSSFGRHCSRGNGHAVVTGHPRLERRGNCNIPVNHVAKEKTQGRTAILWSPHFSVLMCRKWSSFLDHHETIIRLIDERPNLFLLVRPHPFLRTTLAKLEDWGPERVTAWFTTLNERNNAHVDTWTDHRPAFELSSALMADAGSFLVEYLRTGKPVCHLTGRDDIGLTEEVRELACFYPGAAESEIASFLDRIQSCDDPLAKARQDACQAYFGPDNQTPSQAILDEIANTISDFPSVVTGAPLLSSRHEEAFVYWVKATTTFLAPEDYYHDQEQKLREILQRHAQGRFAADIGCGNGRFTILFSNHFELIEAIDPNEQLIAEARENAIRKGISNISYNVERLEHAETLSSYDFVSCMGVTSGLIEDDVFLKAIWKLKAAMRPGAKLLMKDSLSLSTPEAIEWDGYTAIYRNISAYLGAFEAAGLSVMEELVIAEDDEKKRTNRLFVFESRTS